MKYDPRKHHRRSIRLKTHDYAAPGAYFVTICVQHLANLFGQIHDGEMQLNEAGQAIDRWWHEIPEKFPTVDVDAWVVMPNHVHGIIVITQGAGTPVGTGTPTRSQPNAMRLDGRGTPTCVPPDAMHSSQMPQNAMRSQSDARDIALAANTGADTRVCPYRDGDAGLSLPSLGRVVQWFKTMTTNEYIRGVKCGAWSPFEKRLWQRNYYEHIIRNEQDWARIRNYVANNPARWIQDRLHPDNPSKW